MKLLQLGQQVFTIDAFAAPQLASTDDLKDHPHRSVGDPPAARHPGIRKVCPVV
jgi:hypothetical protein